MSRSSHTYCRWMAMNRTMSEREGDHFERKRVTTSHLFICECVPPNVLRKLLDFIANTGPFLYCIGSASSSSSLQHIHAPNHNVLVHKVTGSSLVGCHHQIRIHSSQW